MLEAYTIGYIIVVSVLVLVILIRSISRHNRGRVILESKITKLSPRSLYTVKYKKSFMYYDLWTVTPSADHNTIMTENIMYNGRKDITVNIYITGVIIYSVYLRDVQSVDNKVSTGFIIKIFTCG